MFKPATMWPIRLTALEGAGMGGLRLAIGELIVGFITAIVGLHPRTTRPPKPEITVLAESMLDSGRMWRDSQPTGNFFVHVCDLSFRFRENRKAVIQALLLLESQGFAKRTKHRALWRLVV